MARKETLETLSPEEERIRQILLKYKNIAVVGMSKNPQKPARKVPKYLMAHGYNIIPVNPTMEKTLGRKVYPSIADIPPDVKIDLVEVFRPSEQTPEIVRQVVERKKKVGDVKAVWLQEGIKHPESRRLAEEAGLEYVEDKCMYKEHKRLILGEEPDEI